MRNRARILISAALLASAPLLAGRFYDDDPLLVEPPPLPVKNALARRLNDQADFFLNTFGHPGERNTGARHIAAQGVNTLGDPLDGPWYVRRHYWRRLSLAELMRGPETPLPDLTTAVIVRAKAEGITPGFTIIDARKRRYFIKFDPPKYPELATAADVISSKFFYALGYHVPGNTVIFLDPAALEIGEDVRFIDKHGRSRPMERSDLHEILAHVPRDKGGRVRAVASFAIPGTPLGPFRYHGVRRDDPNDTVPHEHRRDLRGLSIFAAWLGHEDSRAINTLDVLVPEEPPHIRHYLIDFGSTLGSASTGPNSPRSGGEYLFAWDQVTRRAFTFGLVVPSWARARWPDLPAVGRFEADIFDPESWVPEYPNPAFANRLRDDEFWAAKQVAAFTDEEIRAVVQTGRYSNPEAEEYVLRTLAARRDKIARAFLNKVLPLDRFEVVDGRLVFDDLAARAGMPAVTGLMVAWSRYDNAADRKSPLAASGFELPAQLRTAPTGAIFAADISRAGAAQSTTVYLRKKASSVHILGIDRRW